MNPHLISENFTHFEALRKIINNETSEINSNQQTFLIQKHKKIIYSCSFPNCTKKFREKGNLKTHIRTHTGEKPYVCSKNNCGKSFMTLGNLKSHQHNHADGAKLMCSFEKCGKIYNSREKLELHERIHSGKGIFVCPFNGCNKNFNEKGNLKTHFRIHTGEKPYICNFPGCPHAFKALGHLKDHLKIHYNIKPYGCQLCSLKFARSSTLKIHMRTHTGEKPHTCPFLGCNKKFSEKGNMKTHFKTHLAKNNELKIQDIFAQKVNENNCDVRKISDFKIENNQDKFKALSLLLQENKTVFESLDPTSARTPDADFKENKFQNEQKFVETNNLINELVQQKLNLESSIQINADFIRKLILFQSSIGSNFLQGEIKFNNDFPRYLGNYLENINFYNNTNNHSNINNYDLNVNNLDLRNLGLANNFYENKFENVFNKIQG